MDGRVDRRSWVFTAVAVVVALAAPGEIRTAAPAPARPVPARPPTGADVQAEFPYETASDVVSYADHVALVTAVSEAELPASALPKPVASGERTIARRVTFRVDETLWSRPDAPAAPAELTAVWWGWLMKGERRVPFVVHGTPWVFVGGQYLMPIAYDGSAFSPIQPFAVFRFDRAAVALEDQDTALARQLARRSRREAADVFVNAVPDPLAVRYGHLLPRQRLAAVMAERASEGYDQIETDGLVQCCG